MKHLSGTSLGLCFAISLSGLSCWYFGRRIIFLSRLRNHLKTGFLPKNLKLGDYVVFEGSVVKADKNITAPYSKEKCVFYKTQKMRIGEKITTKGKRFNFGIGTIFNFRKQKVPLGGALGSSVSSTNRELVTQVLSSNIKQTSWYIKQVTRNEQYLVNLETFDSFSKNLVQLKVFDIQKYFEPRVSFEEFSPSKTRAGTDKHFCTVGFKIVEQSIKESQILTVLGEVQLIEQLKDGNVRVSISSPSSTSLIDFKSARVKPFLVSTFQRKDLERQIDKDLLFQLLKLVPSFGFPALSAIYLLIKLIRN